MYNQYRKKFVLWSLERGGGGGLWRKTGDILVDNAGFFFFFCFSDNHFTTEIQTKKPTFCLATFYWYLWSKYVLDICSYQWDIWKSGRSWLWNGPKNHRKEHNIWNSYTLSHEASFTEMALCRRVCTTLQALICIKFRVCLIRTIRHSNR